MNLTNGTWGRKTNFYNQSHPFCKTNRNMCLHIESTSYCPSGVAPRWTWWIRGFQGSERYEVLGTDEYGMGLYLFRFNGDKPPLREELLNHQRFSLPALTSKQDALNLLTSTLVRQGWTEVSTPHS